LGGGATVHSPQAADNVRQAKAEMVKPKSNNGSSLKPIIDSTRATINLNLKENSILHKTVLDKADKSLPE
jgi:hypothetical protein